MNEKKPGIKEIEKHIDILNKKAGEKRQKKFRYSRKLTAFPVGSIFALAVVCIVTAGVLFSTLVDDTQEINVEQPVTWDDTPVGEINVFSDPINGYAGETYEVTHWLNYTNTNNGNFTFEFNFSDDGSGVLAENGIIASIWYNGEDITEDTLEIAPGENKQLTCKYELHKLLIPDTYNVTLSVDIVS